MREFEVGPYEAQLEAELDYMEAVLAVDAQYWLAQGLSIRL